jgi:hydroxymethylbilane synthase
MRLGLVSRISEYFSLEISLPVPGQGALGIECRSNDADIIAKLKALDDPRTRFEVTAERSFLAKMGGGCAMPIGALARIRTAEGRKGPIDKKSELVLTGCVTSADGRQVVKGEMSAAAGEAEELGHKLAKHLLKLGAQTIIDELNQIAPLAVSPP